VRGLLVLVLVLVLAATKPAAWSSSCLHRPSSAPLGLQVHCSTMSSYNISMLRLALLLLPAVTTAADDDDATAAQRCGGPVFGGALDLGGHLAVVFRSVGSDWLALRGTGGFDVQHGGRWHAAPVSTAMGVNNPSGSNVINLAPVPGLSTSVAITQVRYRCHLDNSSKSCVKGEVEGCSVYASSGPVSSHAIYRRSFACYGNACMSDRAHVIMCREGTGMVARSFRPARSRETSHPAAGTQPQSRSASRTPQPWRRHWLLTTQYAVVSFHLDR
jgi:hypothetical protein